MYFVGKSNLENDENCLLSGYICTWVQEPLNTDLTGHLT